MNTILTRSNAVFAFTLSNLAVLTAVLVLSTLTKDYSALVDIKINTVRKFVKNLTDFSSNEPSDLGLLFFDLDADFEKVFDWNTKQLFLYLSAEYQTKNNALSQVVLWDNIMLRNKNKKLTLRNSPIKYYFWDDGHGLRGNNITLTLGMNVIPNSGFLPIHLISGSKHQFRFPTFYEQSPNA